MTAAFVGYALVVVPRVHSDLMGDVDRAGWAGAFAARLAGGARLYQDVVVTMPPGAIFVMGLIERMVGRPVLAAELAVVTLARLGTALVAARLAEQLDTRRTGLLVFASTLALTVGLTRESADEPLAALLVMVSLAMGARAFLAPEPAARRGFLAAGWLAAAALGFHTATGAGALAGWLIALARFGKGSARRSWGLGVLGGLGSLTGVALAIGAHPVAAVRAVVVDGWELLGGWFGVLGRAASSAVGARALSASLAVVALLAALALRVARRRGSLDPGEPSETRPDGLAVVAALAAAMFAAAALGVLRGSQLPRALMSGADALRNLVGLGFVLALLFAFAARGPARCVWRTLALVSVAVGVARGLAEPAAPPTALDGPLIPVALLALFVALERAAVRGAQTAALVGALSALFGLGYERAALASARANGAPYFDGLHVSVRGAELIRLAQRVRELAPPGETVLIMPGDPELGALIGRPAPPLRGGLVFAGAYPARLVEGDLRALRDHPPRIIVRMARNGELWRRVFGAVGDEAPAARLVEAVDRELGSGRYRRDASFRCLYFFDQGLIEVWVRR
ncbi:MAG: hypothetical protein OZ921_11580 [Sorangiineae bacterium]|nr:hypothetical protein [Sorangiineae bacterium]